MFREVNVIYAGIVALYFLHPEVVGKKIFNRFIRFISYYHAGVPTYLAAERLLRLRGQPRMRRVDARAI